jgi:predicted nucleic acid-binding protein
MVVDASVWVSRLVPHDVNHATSRGWLQARLAGDDLLVAPVLLLVEVAGAVSRRTRRPSLAKRAIEVMMRLPGLRLVPVDSRLGRAAAQLAADLGLRGADAIYVATAHQLGITLVTWDVDQCERAGRLIVVQTPTTG